MNKPTVIGSREDAGRCEVGDEVTHTADELILAPAYNFGGSLAAREKFGGAALFSGVLTGYHLAPGSLAEDRCSAIQGTHQAV